MTEEQTLETVADWYDLEHLDGEYPAQARALFSEEEIPNIGNYQFTMMGEKMVRRLKPELVRAAPAVPGPNVLTFSSNVVMDAPRAVEAGQDVILHLRLEELHESPLNPRKRYPEAGLKELAGNLRQVGIIQALVARPSRSQPGKYEIVAGHRRFRAAGIAALATAPVSVREMSDTTALDVMLSENLQRVDLNPMEEADGLQSMLALRDEAGGLLYSRSTAAAKIGKSEQHVGDMLRLLRLPKKAREAIEAQTIGASHGYIIAKLPTAELRQRLAEEALRGFGEGPWSKRELQDHVRRNYMVELRGSAFDQKDGKLVPVEEKDGERVAGGACTDCPWNSANMGEGEEGAALRSQHLCTNPGCYDAKVTTNVEAVKAKAVAEGKLVIQGAAANRYVYHDGTVQYNSGMVRLDQTPEASEINGGKTAPKWKKLITGEVKPKTVVVIDGKGKAYELVERKLAIEAAKKNGFADLFNARAGRGKGGDPAAHGQMDREAKERAEVKARSALAVAGLGALVGEIAKQGILEGTWGALFEVALFHTGCDGEAFLCHRRELEVTKGEFNRPDRESAIRVHKETLTPERLPALVVELLIAGWMKHRGIEATGFGALAAVYGVDLEALKVAAKEEGKKKKVRSQKSEVSAKKAEPEPETVRAHIMRLAEPRGMTAGALEMLAAHVLGQPFESKPFLNAKGNELTAILAAVEELTEYDPEDGYILETGTGKLRCPRCGTFNGTDAVYWAVTALTQLDRLSCAPSCGYCGKVPPLEDAGDEPPKEPRRFPATNAHGVYSDEMAERICFKAPKAEVVVRVLEIREGVWISSPEFSYKCGDLNSHGSPLTERETYPGRDFAIIPPLVYLRENCVEKSSVGGCRSARQIASAKAILGQIDAMLAELVEMKEVAGQEEALAAAKKAGKRKKGGVK